MPLMMPAAVMGIHAIWIAQIVMPITPNKAKLTMNSSTMPCQLKRV